MSRPANSSYLKFSYLLNRNSRRPADCQPIQTTATVSRRSTTRRQTLGACTPIDDFRFLDPVAGPIRRSQTGHRAHRAVDVHGLPANAADQMMVIIAHPIFVASRRPGRLNPPNQPLLSERPQRVVHRLPRNGPDLRANLPGNFVRRRMRPPRQHLEHGHPLGGHPQPTSTQEFSRITRHARQSNADSGHSQEVDQCQICRADPLNTLPRLVPLLTR
jgi:hypothetical protein